MTDIFGQLEVFYDAVPRANALAQGAGPFTLFVANPGVAFPFYARPRLGATEFSTDDVRKVLRAQRAQGVPMTFEWVEENSPSLAAAFGEIAPVQRFPLLVYDAAARSTGESHDSTVDHAGGWSVRILDPMKEKALAAEVSAAVGSAFGETDVAEPSVDGAQAEPTDEATNTNDGTNDEALDQSDLQVVAGAFDDSGRPVGGGVAMIRGTVAELAGIGVIPRARRQGLGASLTETLTRAALARGVETVFLSAGSDQAAEIYRRAGFRDVATACIAELPNPSLQWLTPDDWLAFKQIRLASLMDTPVAFGVTHADSLSQPDDQWRERANGVVLAQCGDRPLAMGGLYVRDENRDEGFIWGMWTDPTYRRLGLASDVLSALTNRAKQLGRTRVSLHVNTQLGAARAAYLKAGFVPTGEIEALRAHSGQEIERLELRLD